MSLHVGDQTASLLTSNEGRSSDDFIQKVKCVFVGDSTVGKTSLLVSYTTNGYPKEHVPTAFDNYSVLVKVNNQPIRLQLSDTAGQDDFSSLRVLCYPHTDVFILVFSVVCPASFKSITKKWIKEIEPYREKSQLLLLGNRCDLRDDIPTLLSLSNYNEQPISEQQALCVADEIGAVAYIECSALTQKNLKDAFDTAIMASLNPVHMPRIRNKSFLKWPSIRKKLETRTKKLDHSCSQHGPCLWKKMCCFY